MCAFTLYNLNNTAVTEFLPSLFFFVRLPIFEQQGVGIFMRKSEKPGFYPILISLEKLPCLVVGGGDVACRKVLSLLEFNGDVSVVSPRVSKQLISLSEKGKIRLIRKYYTKEIIKKFKIVFCATDNPKINKKVHDDCKREGILINVADNPPLCDFILPANIKRGDLTVSVSSQGSAPFYTREVKKKLNGFITPIYKDIISLAGEFRKHLLRDKRANSARTKAKMFRIFTSTNWEKVLAENGKTNSQHYIKKILKELDSI